MLSRTLKMAFWLVYDHLGRLLIVNVLAVLLLMAPAAAVYGAAALGDPGAMLAIGLPAAVVGFGIAAPVLTAGLAHMAKECIDNHETSLGAFFIGLRRYAWRASRIGLCYVAAVACLGTSTWFYASHFGAALPWLGYGLSALALWALIFALLTALLVMPALVQKNGGVIESLKLSALLVLDNPFFCMGIGLHWALLAGLAVVPPVALLFSIAPQVVLVSSAYEILSRKYAAIEAQAKTEASGSRPKGRMKIDWHDDEDDYLNRGFRDFLFPWKG